MIHTEGVVQFKSKLLVSLAFIASLATAAYAQWQIANHSIPVGRGGGVSGFNAITPSATSGIALVSRGSALDPSFTTVVVAGGGTNCVVASGTCLDNITGFSSTGFVKRTGAGTYSFIADPVPVANGGTNCAAASGTCLDNITGFASTGFVKRTGAGAYSFIADPVPVANGGTGIASGTSGGVPYFSAGTTIASSGALTANVPVIGGGAGVAPSSGTRTGNTTVFATSTGSFTTNNCIKVDANGNLVDAGAACGGSSNASTKQYLTSGSGATYTTPANARSLHIVMIGGGGGGGAATTNAGATGGTTTFNSVNANGGGGGNVADTGAGAGGTGGTGAASLRLPGSGGAAAYSQTTSGVGGQGAPGIFGLGAPAQKSALAAAGGNPGGTNTGAGGSGGWAITAAQHGAGGGAGEYVELNIASPAGTYTYTIGGGGAGGAAGVQAGGNGGSGIIIVTEY